LDCSFDQSVEKVMMNEGVSKVRVTILGSGTSQGVPVIACDCHVCASSDPFDKRLRSSIMISVNGQNYVIDSGPDFRQQMLNHSVKSLRAVIFTHEHKDHLAGLDDVRAFNYREQRDMEIYCTDQVKEALHREFHYVFKAERYPGIPSLNLNRIENAPFKLIDGPVLRPVEVMHYKMRVFGYRLGDFTYITDAKTVSSKEIYKIKGSKILIINALHQSEHLSHFNLKEALEFIEEVKPERAYLTHISHLFGKHREIEKLLPPNVFPAYDGLTFDFELSQDEFIL
jgi:phosphoribosyl 1,2-cyclic phosphate phosphodiesterase